MMYRFLDLALPETQPSLDFNKLQRQHQQQIWNACNKSHRLLILSLATKKVLKNTIFIAKIASMGENVPRATKLKSRFTKRQKVDRGRL